MALAAAAIPPATKAVALVLVAGLAIIAGVMSYRKWKGSRIAPEELERRRRAALVANGKMGDATVTEMRGDLLFYTYAVRGVVYTASQDLSPLRTLLPADLTALVGPVLVRYQAQNPANSIVLAEEWSGLRVNQPRS